VNLFHERYLSTDLHFLIEIVVSGESLNSIENSKKLWRPPEFFHKKSQEKSFFNGSTIRDSSIGYKLEI